MQFQAYMLQKNPSWAAIHIKAPPSQERTPVHFCILMDVSGSMDDNNKLKTVILSLQFLLDFLGSQDRISLITFSKNATIILNHSAILSEEKANLRTRLSIIQTEDITNMSAAIIRAREVLQKDTHHIKQGILLLTDGYANHGIVDTEPLVDVLIQLLTDFPGTSLSSVAYGLDHNKELLQDMATKGGGSYSTVNSLEDVATVFGDILGGLVSCISQQIRVLLPKDTVLHSRYPKTEINMKMEIMVGDLPAEMEAVFLAQLPKGTSLELKGYDFKTHQLFELSTNIIETDNEEINANNEAHYIRFQVVHMIEEVVHSETWSDTKRSTKKTEIQHLLTNIYTHRSLRAHSLWDLLINELEECIRVLEYPQLRFHADNLYRNISVVGQQRGTPSTYYRQKQSLSLKPTYSNQTQRYISTELCRNAKESQSIEGEYHSYTSSPMKHFDMTVEDVISRIVR
jgi:hypothetical protein